MRALLRIAMVSALLALSVSAFGQNNSNIADFGKQWQ